MRRVQKPRPEMSQARQSGYYNISEASELSGVSAKMIRHYEQIGLMPEADRTDANYRIFSQSDIHTLQFIKRARSLGFSMKKIATLLNLYQDKGRPSSEVKRLAEEHIQSLDEAIKEMQEMRDTLANLARHCRGDELPDCPILEGISCSH